MRPDYLVSEIAEAFRPTKEIRRYWGPGAAEREDLLAAIQKELKSSGKSTTLGQEWENHDIGLNGYFSNEGRLFSSTEQFDQALCFGFRVCTTRIARSALCFLTLGAAIVTWAAYPDLRFAAVFSLPFLGQWYVLAQRARMRDQIWDAVEAVMERVGAKRYETGIGGALFMPLRVTRDGVVPAMGSRESDSEWNTDPRGSVELPVPSYSREYKRTGR